MKNEKLLIYLSISKEKYSHKVCSKMGRLRIHNIKWFHTLSEKIYGLLHMEYLINNTCTYVNVYKTAYRKRTRLTIMGWGSNECCNEHRW